MSVEVLNAAAYLGEDLRNLVTGNTSLFYLSLDQKVAEVSSVRELHQRHLFSVELHNVINFDNIFMIQFLHLSDLFLGENSLVSLERPFLTVAYD